MHGRIGKWGNALALALAMTAFSGTAHGVPISGQGTWETTLHARDIDGDSVADAYYDDVLDLTWLADWNADGAMRWDAAVAWAAALDVHGVTGWRLPTITVTGTSACNISYSGGTDCGYNVDTSASELAHMFYVTLGNAAVYNTSGVQNPTGTWGLTNTANFTNMVSYYYWSGTDDAPSSGYAWYFGTVNGFQSYDFKVFRLYAVAVRPGDVAATAAPEPPTLALLLGGLLALGLRRRPRLGAAK